MAAGLGRFVVAQDPVYDQAICELRAGAKQGHWMWFIFPQIAGLGRSSTARFYAIRDLAEARDYLAHETLGPRIGECTEAAMGWAGRRRAEAIFGPLDAMKFKSSLTLFEAAGGHPVFSRALEAFFDGERDARTLERI